jgi:two-component system, cell cycle response regulator
MRGFCVPHGLAKVIRVVDFDDQTQPVEESAGRPSDGVIMRVLIAEDDVISLHLLESWVSKWGNDVVTVRDGQSAWELLRQENAPRLAMLDWVMPGLDGLEICSRLRAQVDCPYTYVILVTAKAQAEDVIKGLESGADDYVSKPVKPLELRARLQTGRRILELQQQLLDAQQELRIKATRDFLTGLWNRQAIVDFLERELRHSVRDSSAVGILLADMDHFKRINDTYGHLAGDVVLCETAQRMRGALRQCDWIGRYGGEEFLVVLPGCNYPEGLQSAERVRHAVAASPFTLPFGALPVTLSVGMTTTNGAEGVTTCHLLDSADQALYEAKNRGRNRVEYRALFDRPALLAEAIW